MQKRVGGLCMTHRGYIWDEPPIAQPIGIQGPQQGVRGYGSGKKPIADSPPDPEDVVLPYPSLAKESDEEAAVKGYTDEAAGGPAPEDAAPSREGVRPFPGETEAEYLARIRVARDAPPGKWMSESFWKMVYSKHKKPEYSSETGAGDGAEETYADSENCGWRTGTRGYPTGTNTTTGRP